MTRLRILAFAPNPWEGMWMNRQQLLSRIARHADIVYSNGMVSTWDRGWKGHFFDPGHFLARDGIHLDRTPGRYLRVPRFAALDRIAIGKAARRWRRQLDTLGTGPVVAYVFHPQFGPLVDAIAPDYVVYHTYDLLKAMPGKSTSGTASEDWMLRRADLVIASSQTIAEELQRRGGKPVNVVGNGVDYAPFAQAIGGALPADMAAIPQPRIGYIGRMNRKFDVDLLVEVASARPDWNFVLIGPVVDTAPEQEAGFARARTLANVHFLGARDREVLPQYTAALDVGLLLYRTAGAWTEGIYPLKLHEYLACGLPVVASDFPVVRTFPDVVWIARSAAEWQDRISAAVAGTGPAGREQRLATARANSWDERAQQLWQLLQGLGGRRTARAG